MPEAHNSVILVNLPGLNTDLRKISFTVQILKEEPSKYRGLVFIYIILLLYSLIIYSQNFEGFTVLSMAMKISCC